MPHSAIIYINDDISQSIQDTLSRQLYLSEIISSNEFDERVEDNKYYHMNVHQNGLRILVLRPVGDCYNACLADIVLYFKNGLLKVESNRCGAAGHSLTTDNITLDRLFDN